MIKTEEQQTKKLSVEEEFYEMVKYFVKSTISKSFMSQTIEDIDKCNYILSNYKDILVKTKILAKELNLTNSLEYANLYTYLLWNGYFSKDKLLRYEISGKVETPELKSLDIMIGQGCCLHFSDMLKNFLNESGFNSVILLNNVDKKSQVYYEPEIVRTVSKPKFKVKVVDKLLSMYNGNIGDHAFNLIYDNDKFYIYDSTNLMILELVDKYNAKVVMGKGNFKLHPNLSYTLNPSVKEIKTLDKLHTSKKIISPYDETNYLEIWESCIELFKQNKKLLEDYYCSSKENIDSIAKELMLIKKK